MPPIPFIIGNLKTEKYKKYAVRINDENATVG
jgi:hypothetical protein